MDNSVPSSHGTELVWPQLTKGTATHRLAVVEIAKLGAGLLDSAAREQRQRLVAWAWAWSTRPRGIAVLSAAMAVVLSRLVPAGQRWGSAHQGLELSALILAGALGLARLSSAFRGRTVPK